MKALRPEDEHRKFLDFANLLPLKAWSPVVQADYSEALRDYMIPDRWKEISGGYFVRTPGGLKLVPYPAVVAHDLQRAFQDFLDKHFPVAEFPRFRQYLKDGDPRWPLVRTPVERWMCLAAVNEGLRLRANAYSATKSLPVNTENWQPDAICAVCGALFPLTRKDKTTCSDPCALVHRQREWRKRKASGAVKMYVEARKRKQAQNRERKKR